MELGILPGSIFLSFCERLNLAMYTRFILIIRIKFQFSTKKKRLKTASFVFLTIRVFEVLLKQLRQLHEQIEDFVLLPLFRLR